MGATVAIVDELHGLPGPGGLVVEVHRAGGPQGVPASRHVVVLHLAISRAPEAGVLVRKFSQLTPLSLAKLDSPMLMLCGVSCESAAPSPR